PAKQISSLRVNQLIQIGDAVGEPFPYEPQRESAAAMQRGVAIAMALSRGPSASVVRSRRIGRGYNPLTARHIWTQPALVCAAERWRRRQLPVSGKTGNV